MLYELSDTIAAIATPLGIGGVGIIRLSGPDSETITQKIFSASSKKPLSAIPSHTLTRGWIFGDGDAPIDEVLVAVMRAPNSYTGETTVEISAHGGPVVLNQILSLALANGARGAGPGEFTFRAFSNGKLDLAKAEAVADLISAKTGLSAEAALTHLSGSFSAKIQSFRSKLLDLLSAFEAALDHAEEDIRFISKEDSLKALETLDLGITSILDSFDRLKYLKNGLRCAIIGKPNAGKSSLLNALIEKDRAIVTDLPGTTRDTIEETVDIKGFPVILTDTAGLRPDCCDQAELIGQSRALEAAKTADIIIWVLDASRSGLEEDRYLASAIAAFAKDKIIIPVWNKTDLAFKADEGAMINLLPARAATPVKLSAKSSLGLSGLEEALVTALSFPKDLLSGAVTVNARHYDALKRSKTALGEASGSIKSGFSEEIQALHLREALNYLGEITGETATEEILDSIFSRFCIGK